MTIAQIVETNELVYPNQLAVGQYVLFQVGYGPFCIIYVPFHTGYRPFCIIYVPFHTGYRPFCIIYVTYL
ncbi:hypothetical protein [Bacillus oleivorans]|uniref:hypothetical protein n=1 Tax=Bacillus oleivorans TaxID=1448271 RepID=UPI001FE5FE20